MMQHASLTRAIARAQSLRQSLFSTARKPALTATLQSSGLLRSKVAAVCGVAPVAFTAGYMMHSRLASSSSVASCTQGKNPSIEVYQYAICPFCHKVRAVLDYFKVPYDAVEVNPIRKQELKFSESYKKVPISIINGAVVHDSGVIVEKLEQVLADFVPTQDLQRFFNPEVAHWLKWVDTSLAVLLFPNITRNFSESWQAFGYIMDVPHFGMIDKVSNRVLGPVAMWAAQGKIKRKYNIDDEREALYAAINHWVSSVGDKQFLTGDKPSMADCAVYGCLRSIRELQTFDEVMVETGVGPWYKRMEAAVGESQLKNYR